MCDVIYKIIARRACCRLYNVERGINNIRSGAYERLVILLLLDVVSCDYIILKFRITVQF